MTQALAYHCFQCGADNAFVNQCGCDKGNMPTTPPRSTLAENYRVELSDKKSDGETCEWVAIVSFHELPTFSSQTWTESSCPQRRGEALVLGFCYQDHDLDHQAPVVGQQRPFRPLSLIQLFDGGDAA